MLSENIYTNSQKIALTILKHEGVPILWGEYHYVLIVQILFSPWLLTPGMSAMM